MDCIVVNVVAPNQFWVIKKDQDDSAVKQVEILIKEAVQSGLLTLASAGDKKLVAVAVEKRKYHRGSICGRKNETSIVFLIDYGRFIEVENSKIYSLPEEADTIEPLAFKVQAFGVLPTKKEVQPDRTLLRKVTHEWSQKLHRDVVKLLSKNPEIIVTEREKGDNIIYADILIKSGGTSYSLRKLLEKYDAIYNEKAFRKRVIENGNESTSISSCLSDSSSGINSSCNLSFLGSGQKVEKNRNEEEELKHREAKHSRKVELESSSSSISDKQENALKIETWQKKNQEYKRLETLGSSPTKKSEANSSTPSGSSSGNVNVSSKINEIMNSNQPKEKTLSGSELKEKGRALLQRLKSRRSNSSAVSEASSSSSKDLLLNENSKCSETSSNILLFTQVESGKSSSCGKQSEMELNINKGEVSESDHVADIFTNDMPLKASRSDVPKKSIFEELLKEDRSQKNGNSSRFHEEIVFRPAGKLDVNYSKTPLKPKAYSSRHLHSNHSQSSQSSERKDKIPEVKQSEVSSLKDVVIRKPLMERNTARSDVVKISHNRQKQKFFETQVKNKYYWPTEGVLRETISKKVPLDRPLVLATDSIQDIELVEKFNDLKISADIIKNLQKHGKYENLSSIQKYSVNALRRNLNTVMISGAKTGKSLSYIMALIDFVQDETNFEQLPDGNGATVVILCSSTKSAQNVYETCHKILGNRSDLQRKRSKIQVHLAHGGGAEKEMWVNLTNGCDILISTPHCLARLLECPLITNFERLCCLVIDEADIITHDPFISELLTILKLADSSTSCRSSMKSYQKVICSEKWTPDVASLVKRTMEKDHVVIFANFLEAAIYARLKPHLFLVFGEENKKEVLFDKVGDKFGKQKILIICEDSKDVIMLKEEIEKRGKLIPLIAHDGVEPDKINEAADAWKYALEKQIMICTDFVLPDLKIEDAEVLVHYSLPYRYKTNFGYRFSTLVKNYKNIQSENKEIENLSVYCLIDEFNHYQLPHIVEFSQRLGGKISQAVLEKCEEIKIKREIAKESRPLCFDMLELGHCKYYKTCPRRHAFNENLDAPLKSQPTSGFVSFMVLTVHDACHFSARILEHIDVNDVKTPVKSDYLSIGLKLAKHFKKLENCIPHGMPKTGDICVVQDEKNNFHRGQIIEYFKVDEHDQPIEVNVRLMDRGNIVTKKNFELYEIPKELAEYPPQAVDIVLCGLLPMDFDSYWGRPATERARELLVEKRLKENEKWIGRIVLSLNNILCLDPIELCEQLSLYNVVINKFSIGEKLMKENLAVFNENHLKMLYELCEKGGITVPKYKQKKRDISNVKPQWAFLENFFEKVYFRTAFSTSTLFVVLAKFRDLVKNLEEECYFEAKKLLQRKDRPKVDVRIGKVCLAFYKDDGTWNRAVIENLKDDWIQVFFVDHGDSQWVKEHDLLPIPDVLISKLPFQAIECSLLGINHEIVADLDSTLNSIYDFSFDGCDLLYANVITKDLKPTTTGGKKYEINLLNTDGKSLSKKLVDANLAEPLESQKNHLMDIDVGLFIVEEEKQDDDDDEEEIWRDVEVEKHRNENNEIVEKNQTNDIMGSSNEIILNDVEKEEENPDLEYRLTNEQIEAMLEDDDVACDYFQELATKEMRKCGVQYVPRIFGITQKNNAITQGENPPNANSESRKAPKKATMKKILEKLAKQKKEIPQVPKASKVPLISQVPQLTYVSQLNHASQVPQLTQARKIPLVVMPEGIFTPNVYWIQNHSEVNLRVILTDVKDYYLQVKYNKILFSCDLNGRHYAVEHRLFGAVCPKMTEVHLKAFYVEISLKKLCSDFWPRLILDKNKHPNIYFDNDRLPEFTHLSLSDKLRDKVMDDMKNGIVKKPRKYKNIAPVPYDGSDDEYEYGNDNNDDDEDDEVDPYDCLS